MKLFCGFAVKFTDTECKLCKTKEKFCQNKSSLCRSLLFHLLASTIFSSDRKLENVVKAIWGQSWESLSCKKAIHTARKHSTIRRKKLGKSTYDQGFATETIICFIQKNYHFYVRLSVVLFFHFFTSWVLSFFEEYEVSHTFSVTLTSIK